MNNGEFKGLMGKMGGLKVKSMIETVEQQMAAGTQVSAGPAHEAEAKALQRVREENRKSADNASNIERA